jgi:hypothetical protein
MVDIVIVLVDCHVLLGIDNEFVVNELFSKSCLFEVDDT